MKYNKKDLKGQRFGRLLVLEETDKRQDKCIAWKCKCDCGNIVEVSSKRLKTGVNSSCSCLQEERQKYSMKKLQNKQLVENTNIDLIKKEKANSNSKTGYRGVCYINAHKKYKASIVVNKKHYHLRLFY